MGGRGSYSGKSSASKAIRENTDTQSSHLKRKSPYELEVMYKELGVSNPSGAANAIFDYTGDGYKLMRKGQLQEEVKLIDEVIAKQPKWDGTIYRGMSVKDDFIENLQNSVGDSIQFSSNKPTSFSSSKAQATKFSTQVDGNNNSILFKMKNKRGSSITHNTQYPTEKEVLHKSAEKYKIKSVNFDTSKGIYVVELEDSE